MAKFSWSRILFWSVVILLLVLASPLGLIILFERKPEKVAMTGLPLAQAISDYRSDHGLLPLGPEDLVPTYLSEMPKDWVYRGGFMVRHAGQPHSYISYHFEGDYANQWRFDGDSSFNKRQLNVPIPITKHPVLTGEALFASRLAEYERRIKRHPDEISFYADKINYLRLEDRSELLREECERASSLFPDWWRPQMMLASLDRSNPEAIERFAIWVRAHGSFENYWYLARHHRTTGNIPAALSILSQALNQPVVLEPTNSVWRGTEFLFDSCKFAYESGDLELTHKLAGIWQTLRTAGEDKSWLAFQAAAELRSGQVEPAIEHARQLAQFAARWGVRAENIDDLLRAAESSNTNFVYEAGNLKLAWSLFTAPRP